jgi:hypothetical protein
MHTPLVRCELTLCSIWCDLIILLLSFPRSWAVRALCGWVLACRMEAVAGELATADRERTAAAEAIQSLEARLAQTQAALEEAVRCSEFNRAMRACAACFAV